MNSSLKIHLGLTPSQILICVITFLCAYTPVFGQSYLRLFGTNVYDFSSLASTTGDVPYRFQGKVSYIYPQSIRVTRVIGVEYVYVQPSSQEIMNDSPGDLLQQLYAAQVAKRGTSLGEIMSMSPELRQNFQPVDKTANFYLLNYPFAVRVGTSIDCFALPTSAKDFWDYGKPYSGDISQLKIIYHVRPNGIVAEHLYSAEEKTAMKQATDARVVTWLLSQATNGDSSAQYSLGLHYLNGQGVETNKVMAIDWLKKAADQGDTDASNKLEELTMVQTNLATSVKSP